MAVFVAIFRASTGPKIVATPHENQSKKPEKIGACGGLPGAAPQTPLTGGTPRESTPVAPGGPSRPQVYPPAAEALDNDVAAEFHAAPLRAASDDRNASVAI